MSGGLSRCAEGTLALGRFPELHDVARVEVDFGLVSKHGCSFVICHRCSWEGGWSRALHIS